MISILRVTSAMAAMGRLAGFALLLPIPVALWYEEWTPHPNLAGIHLPQSVLVFVAAFLLVAVFWLPARFFTRRIAHEDLPDREAYLAVALGWLVVAGFAMLPFLLSQTILTPVEAYFEAMSGLTGTGSTVLPDASVLPESIQFWRAFTQWLGGLGIIVLTVGLLSKLTHGGLGSDATVSTRIRLVEVARDLWKIYLAFTLLFIAMMASLLHFHVGLDANDAILSGMTDTFSAYGNGAFFSRPESVAAYDSAAVEGLVALMMVAGAMNFVLVLVAIRRGSVRPFLRDPEIRFFFVWVALAVVGLAALLWATAADPWSAVRDGGFTAVSLATGSGLQNSDYSGWPAAATGILLILVLVGATSGSASGGVKAFRALVLLRTVLREMRRLLHPRAVIPVRVGKRVVPEETISALVAFFFTYLTAWVAGAILLSLLEPGFTLQVAAGTSLAALGNVGANFGANFGELHWYSQLLMSGLMWLGRMEIFAALLVFTPSTWRD